MRKETMKMTEFLKRFSHQVEDSRIKKKMTIVSPYSFTTEVPEESIYIRKKKEQKEKRREVSIIAVEFF